MLAKKIEDVRGKLNKQIENKGKFEEILKTSKRLDKLINIYYNIKNIGV